MSKKIMKLEKKVKRLERKIAVLEELVQAQPLTKCSYLGCRNSPTTLDMGEVSPGETEQKPVCNEHSGELNKNILKSFNIN